MSRLADKWKINYSFDTLRDVLVSGLSKFDLITYDEDNSKFINKKVWDVLFFYKRTFSSTSKDVEIPSDKVLQMHSPKIDGELKVDGEAYIL